MGLARVEPATEASAEAVAQLQVHLWQQAYAEILPAAMVLADPSELAERWVGRISAGGVFLAFEGDETVGIAAGSADGELGEVEVLGVLPRWSRRGHGGRLLGTVAQALRTAGASRGSWWAPESDPSIPRFLAAVGWLPDGGHRGLDTGEGVLTEIRYSGSLDLVVI